MSFSEKTAQGGNVSKDGPTSPENVAPRRKCRAAGDIKGWWVLGLLPFVGNWAMEIASREWFWLGFFSF